MDTPKPKIKKPEAKSKRINFKKVNLKKLNFKKIRISRPKLSDFKRPKLDRAYFKIIFTLVKKELFNFFSTPLAYIVVALFIGVSSILFFSVGQYLAIGTTDLTNLFAYISFTFVIIVPAITMSSISREKQTGTIEYLLTQPLTEVQLLISKFVAYAVFILILLATTLPLVLNIGTHGALDVGQIAMQYIGAWVLGLCLVALGMAVSASLRSEIASFLTTVVIAALLILVGSTIFNLNIGINFIIERLGLLSHYQSISRGVLDVRDVLYFFAFILAFLSITFYLVIKDKFPPKDKNLNYARISLLILIVLTILIGYIGQIIPGRIDFTKNKIYTLSDTSVNVIKEVNDVMSIKLYASDNLPIQFESQIQDVQDLLRDYQTYSNGKIDFQSITVTNTSDASNDAAKAGLQQIRFEVSGSSSSQVAVGYFGIAMNYLDKNQTMNLNDQSIFDNLEYNVTKNINKLANTNLPVIGIVSTSTTYNNSSTNLQSFLTELNDLFTVQSVDLTSAIPTTIKTLVVDGPNGTFTDAEKKEITTFYDNGGNVFFLTNTVTVDPQTFETTANANSLNDLFSSYGVSVNPDLVYDLDNNNLVNAGLLFPVNYPLWVVAKSSGENVSILKDVNEVSYLFGSTLTIDSSKTTGETVNKLLVTSKDSNSQKSSYNLDPSQTWSQQNTDAVQTLAVAIQNAKGGKLVVVGDSKLISDDFNLSTLAENLAFGLGSVEWLSGADSIASIQAKVRTAPRVTLDNSQATTLSVIGVGLPISAVVVLGILRFYLRRKKQEKKYSAD